MRAREGAGEKGTGKPPASFWGNGSWVTSGESRCHRQQSGNGGEGLSYGVLRLSPRRAGAGVVLDDRHTAVRWIWMAGREQGAVRGAGCPAAAQEQDHGALAAAASWEECPRQGSRGTLHTPPRVQLAFPHRFLL